MTEHSLLDNLLQKLLATDDPTEKAAIVAESALEQLPATVALVAQRCTVLRWFDETVVTALLDAPSSPERLPVVQTVMTTLTALPFIEHLAWGLVYHNQTRTGLLAHIPPSVLQYAATLAMPAYNAHVNPSLARVEALYCAVISGQTDVATQILDTLLEDAVRREDWQALLTAFHALEEATALPFVASSISRTPFYYLLGGVARHNLGDLAGALADYNQAIALKPDDATAYYNRGIVRKAQGDLAGALADYNQAIALKPHYTIYTNRGVERMEQGDLAGALADHNQAIALKSDNADAYYNRGLVRGKQGDLAGALADYNQAIALKPDDAVTYYNRGLVRREQGDLAGALADYNQAIALKPDYTVAYLNRGGVRREQGDLAGALADFNQAIALKPDYAEAYKPTVSLGVTYVVVCTYGCGDGRIWPTHCAVIDAGLDGRCRPRRACRTPPGAASSARSALAAGSEPGSPAAPGAFPQSGTTPPSTTRPCGDASLARSAPGTHPCPPRLCLV
jgi:tetratricopeptide (TPR) repeat protein